MIVASAAQERYLKKRRREHSLVWLFRILILVIFLGLWEVSTRAGWMDSFIFSSPSKVVATFADMWKYNSLYVHIGVTLFETLVSFFLVIVISISVTVLLWACPQVSNVLEPYLVVLNSLPKSALAPLLIVWLGTSVKTIIVAGISVAIFGSVINLYTSFKETSPDKIKLIYTLHGNRFQALTKVVLPSSIPQILANMKVNIGLCLVGVIIGEFIGSRQGLGYLIIYGTQTFKLDWVIMSIIVLCLLAMILYAVLNRVEKWYLKKI